MANNYGIYARLNITDPEIANNARPLNASANAYVNFLPIQLKQWQAEDIGNNQASGYFTNPTGSLAVSISNAGNTIITACQNANNLAGIVNSAITMVAAKEYFVAHTNRMSGVTKVTQATATLPHYDTAILMGKSLMNIVSQTDNIQNKSPILACFSSLFCANTMSEYANTLITYPTIIVNSLNVVTVGEGIDSYLQYDSNLSSEQISTMISTITSATSILVDKPANDVAMYARFKAVQAEVTELKQFTNLGQTEQYLINNFIGSEKLKTRLNS